MIHLTTVLKVKQECKVFQNLTNAKSRGQRGAKGAKVEKKLTEKKLSGQNVIFDILAPPAFRK